jgi:hypothetical protein
VAISPELVERAVAEISKRRANYDYFFERIPLPNGLRLSGSEDSSTIHHLRLKLTNAAADHRPGPPRNSLLGHTVRSHAELICGELGAHYVMTVAQHRHRGLRLVSPLSVQRCAEPAQLWLPVVADLAVWSAHRRFLGWGGKDDRCAFRGVALTG